MAIILTGHVIIFTWSDTNFEPNENCLNYQQEFED